MLIGEVALMIVLKGATRQLSIMPPVQLIGPTCELILCCRSFVRNSIVSNHCNTWHKHLMMSAQHNLM